MRLILETLRYFIQWKFFREVCSFEFDWDTHEMNLNNIIFFQWTLVVYVFKQVTVLINLLSVICSSNKNNIFTNNYTGVDKTAIMPTWANVLCNSQIVKPWFRLKLFVYQIA